MADEDLIKSKIGLDTTDAKAAVAELNRGIRVLESGFRASAAGLGDWANTASGLEMRVKSLNGQIELQQRKINALTSEYKKVAAEKGETSRAALDLQIKLNKETESLNKMQSELRQTDTALDGMKNEAKPTATAVEKLDKEQKKATDSAEKLHSKSGNLGKALGTVGKAALAAAAAMGAMVLGIAKLVTGQTEAADDLVDLSTKTGISVERLQDLSYVGKQTGTDLDVMTGSLSKLIRNMDAAKGGKGGAADAFKELGISVTDANGQLRDSQTVFSEAIAALGGVQNETQRDALSMALFGKSAMELNPLIEAGGDEVARLSQEARDMGAVMSEDSVRGLSAFQDGLDGLKDGLKGTAGTLVTAFLPQLQGGLGTLQGYLKDFTGIVKSSNGDMGKAAGGIGGLVGKIVTDAVSQAPQMVQAGLALIQGLINSILPALPALVPAVIQIIMSITQFIWQNIPLLIQTGIQVLLALITGLTTALPQLIPVILGIVPQVVSTLLSNLPLLVTAALQLILALAQGLIAALPQLIEMVPQIIEALITTIISLLPLIGDTAVQLIVALIDGIMGALPKLGEAAGEIVASLAKGMQDLRNKILEVGGNILAGVWEGIVEKKEWFNTQITGFFQGIVTGIKNILGIKSPSTVFAGIGKNMALGLGAGFGDQFRSIQRQMEDAVNGLGNMNVSMNGMGMSPAAAGAGGSGTQVVIQFGDVTLKNDLDIHTLAYRVVDEIQRRR